MSTCKITAVVLFPVTMIILLAVVMFPHAYFMSSKLIANRTDDRMSKARRLLAKNAKGKGKRKDVQDAPKSMSARAAGAAKNAKLKKPTSSIDTKLKKLVGTKDALSKGPVNARTTWIRCNRERIQAELKKSGGGNFLKKATEMWKTSADEEVQPYEAFAMKVQQKPVSAYGAWLNDNRELIVASAEGAKDSLLKKAEGMWLKSSPKEREAYEHVANKAKEGYEEVSSLLISLANVEAALSELGHDVPIEWRVKKKNSMCFRCKLGPIIYYKSSRHLVCSGRAEEAQALLSYFADHGGTPVYKKKKIKDRKPSSPSSPSTRRDFSPIKTPERPDFSPAKTPVGKTPGGTTAYASSARGTPTSTSKAKRTLFSPSQTKKNSPSRTLFSPSLTSKKRPALFFFS